MEPTGRRAAQGGEGALGGFRGGQVLKPYDSFIRTHLRFYGYFRGEPWPLCPPVPGPCPLLPGSLQENDQLHSPSLLPAGLWSVKSSQRRLSTLVRGCSSCPPPHPCARPLFVCMAFVSVSPPPRVAPPQTRTLLEEHGTVVYHSSPGKGAQAAPLIPAPPTALQGSCFTRARVGGAPGPLSSPAAPLEGPQDTTLLFESRFESGNLQKATKYVLVLRPDLYTAKHTQWFYFRVQNTRQEPLYRFTIANMAKPKSLYGQGLQPLLYSQQDAQSHGIGWRRVGTDVCYYRGSVGEPLLFRLSWTMRFPHDGDTCFFAAGYPYTYSDLGRYLRALVADPARSQYCMVRALCRSLAGNTVPLLTITGPGGTAGKRAVVLSARVHPGESGGSWAMRGFLDFLLSPHEDAQLLRRLCVFKVVPMLNPDGVVVGNSRCSLAGRDPNRAYGKVLPSSFPSVWHLRAMVQRELAEREVVLYCDFHGHSRKNNVFMYGCDGGEDGTGTRLRQRVFPLMLSKNAPDKFSFSSCKFQVQKSKEGTGRVSMWRLGVSHSYTLEVAFSGSTLGGRNSHFSVEDLKSLGRLLCDTLLDFCDPAPAKLQQCLVEADVLLQQQMGREPGSGGSWSDVSPSELESRYIILCHLMSPRDVPVPLYHLAQMEPHRKKQLQRRRGRNVLRRTKRSHTSIPVSLEPL
uniref:Cytosolic carboxypeptidase 2 n=1 Tax=Geospiza parvula TaxID=87175 RepID=A0A8U8BS75_GEOPR